jgi:hypothetical protein
MYREPPEVIRIKFAVKEIGGFVLSKYNIPPCAIVIPCAVMVDASTNIGLLTTISDVRVVP